MSALPAHGGNLAAVAARYGVDPASLLDFSANINPAGPSSAVTRALSRIAHDPGVLAPYPDPTAAPLRETIARVHGVRAEHIVVANGGAALIDAGVRATAAACAVVPVPAFSEYARALDAARVRRVTLPLDERFALDAALLDAAIAKHAARLAVLTNPHNPSGRLLGREAMCALVRQCAKRGAVAIVDEAFIDYEPAHSIIDTVATCDNLVVVRSLTKFYGMAGVRIGYAVASSALASSMRCMLPSWAAGTLEQTIAMEILAGDVAYERTTRLANAAAREALRTALEDEGMRVIPSVANFVLVELPVQGLGLDAAIERLVLKHGIVVRDCRDYEGLQSRSYVRVAVRAPDDNARLVRALREVLQCVHVR